MTSLSVLVRSAIKTSVMGIDGAVRWQCAPGCSRHVKHEGDNDMFMYIVKL